jgi:hypothetical protein
MTRPFCRHCHRIAVTRPRGLCWGCYYTPGVREQYPPTSKHGRRGAGAYLAGGFKLPDEPTAAAPGSPEKVAALEARAAVGVALWHPDEPAAPRDYRAVLAVLLGRVKPRRPRARKAVTT